MQRATQRRATSSWTPSRTSAAQAIREPAERVPKAQNSFSRNLRTVSASPSIALAPGSARRFARWTGMTVVTTVRLCVLIL